MFTITFKYETVEFFWVYVWDVIFKQRFSTPQFVRVLPRKIESVGSISVGTTSSDELPYEYSDEATSCQPFVPARPLVKVQEASEWLCVQTLSYRAPTFFSCMLVLEDIDLYGSL